jgi:hypothetical protein
MENKNNNPILTKALPDESIFVLLARDSAAPATIIEWIKNSLLTQPEEKLHKALSTAITMAHEQENVRQAVEKKKVNDRQFKIDEEV